jgi:hypothetical protein
MSKLLTCLVLAGFGLGLNIASAQNVDSDKTNTQDQAKGDAEKGLSAQAAKPPTDCSKLSGPEKDKCIQATPAGPVEMDSGDKSKGKSETAKERDRMKDQSSTDNAAPAQSADSLGRPNDGKKGAATGQGDPNGAVSSSAIPEQSKDTVGHPEQRSTTGEGKPLREPGQDVSSAPADTGTSASQADKQTK